MEFVRLRDGGLPKAKSFRNAAAGSVSQAWGSVGITLGAFSDSPSGLCSGAASGGKCWHPGDAAANLLPVEKLCVGASAGATSVMVTYPMDLVRGKLTVQGGVVNTQYRGMVDCARQTVAEGGVAALYRGMTPNMIGIMPYVGINYLTYETIKEYAPVAPGETLPHPGYLAIAAGIAGTTGQTVAYP